jgi:hypothetical protein
MRRRWAGGRREIAGRSEGVCGCWAAPWVLESSPLRWTHQSREVDEALHGAARRADHLTRVRVAG